MYNNCRASPSFSLHSSYPNYPAGLELKAFEVEYNANCEGKGTERVGLGGPRSEDSFRKELTSKGGRQGKVETECQPEEGKEML